MKHQWFFVDLFLLAFPLVSAGANESTLVADKTEVAVSFSHDNLSKVRQVLKDNLKSSQGGQVVLFDSLDKTLFKNGIVLRLRAFKDYQELTMKVREPARLPSEERWKGWDMKCEQDLSPYSSRISCSITKEIKVRTLKKILQSKEHPNNIVPPEFWAFVREISGHELSNVALASTETADISIEKYKRVKNLGGEDAKVTLEVWTLPNKVVLSELSVKDQTALAANCLTGLSDWLTGIKVESIDLSPGKSEQLLQFLH